MASRNHTAASSHSLGDLTLSIIHFNDIDDGDTYTSGIPSAVAYWANGTDDPTQNRETIGVKYENTSDATGRFTFSSSEDNRNVKLYVFSRT